MENKKVSVIIPVYNVQEYLDRCLESLIHQTYDNLEIVLVDDGSTDNSGQICDNYADKDDRVVVYHIDNSGVSNARNFALKQVSGDLCMFVDSDDYVELNLVQELISAMDQFGVDLVTCADDQRKLSDTEYDVIKVDEYDFNANYQHPISWGVLYKTALIRDLKFALDLYVGEDSLFIAQAINRCDTVVHVNERLYHHILYDESLSQGLYDDRKYTEVIAWQRIVEEFTNQPSKMQKNCQIAFVRRCYSGLIKANNQFDIQKRKFMLKNVRTHWKQVISARIVWKEKVSLTLMAMFGQIYIDLFQTAKRRG
ncbi:glycosyltransferase family 2 protein [Limosilactobacillus fermentum]|uniref:glycosyltransferase family 2 protein n=1 Tax=Limosilactobacillus fermentum TaxID=1613 RepID=UPI00210F4D76|nr:glycosyltransferase family 2 protein [Limosilactobacillus fermentum]UUC15475.1 glycosyltransferase [Limosilactobacillus fermentum]